MNGYLRAHRKEKERYESEKHLCYQRIKHVQEREPLSDFSKKKKRVNTEETRKKTNQGH